MIRSTSGSTMLVAMTLCVERPVFTRIASASRMRSMSVVTESVPRSFAISATVLPAYAGFGS